MSQLPIVPNERSDKVINGMTWSEFCVYRNRLARRYRNGVISKAEYDREAVRCNEMERKFLA